MGITFQSGFHSLSSLTLVSHISCFKMKILDYTSGIRICERYLTFQSGAHSFSQTLLQHEDGLDMSSSISPNLPLVERVL